MKPEPFKKGVYIPYLIIEVSSDENSPASSKGYLRLKAEKDSEGKIRLVNDRDVIWHELQTLLACEDKEFWQPDNNIIGYR